MKDPFTSTAVAPADCRVQFGAAAAGIGVPERFFRSLREAGLAPATELALEDHAAIDRTTFAALSERLILVTAKDAVKCQGLDDEHVTLGIHDGQRVGRIRNF